MIYPHYVSFLTLKFISFASEKIEFDRRIAFVTEFPNAC